MAPTVAATIEPFRNGTSFGDWATRLKYFFIVNKIEDDNDKRAYFITMGGPVIFSQLKLLFPTGNFENVPYEELISKLKARLDRTESDLIQRLRFNTRVQQPDETLQDFALSLRLQAEFCNYGDYKDQAILDRMVAGVKDIELKKKLLSENKLNLATAEKILETWEMTSANSKPITEKEDEAFALKFVPAMGRGKILQNLADVYKNNSGKFEDKTRIPVKDRLGYKNLTDRRFKKVQFENARDYKGQKPAEWRNDFRRQPVLDRRVCNFCGIQGHVARKCYKQRIQKQREVNLVDVPGSSKDSVSDLLNRLNTKDSDDDGDSDSGSNWKRANSRPSYST
ncbi:uncharacterized protein LOC131438735 isoform X2 [Malaya genurostris]|uniref:uncharacterized protein LOC131438735 isoform X2 n=1 Tax=Malaya genurostris TaxID=325434 RepID=UPI0026F3A879|nr:uncharacterized protein LOC131438735 isoform X2 [Malaya genurostris]